MTKKKGNGIGGLFLKGMILIKIVTDVKVHKVEREKKKKKHNKAKTNDEYVQYKKRKNRLSMFEKTIKKKHTHLHMDT